MGFPWKMLVGPALLLGMKAANIDYNVPRNLLIIRVLYGLSQTALFTALAFIYLRISSHGDDSKSLKVKVPSPTGPTEEKEMTYKEYDQSELLKLVKSFGLGAAMTIGIHVYMAVVPALLLQMVTQPITLYDHALFSIYILKKDASKEAKLKRPFVDDSPMARMEAMKREKLSEQEVRETPKQDEDEQPEPVEGDSAVTTGSVPLSKAERRPRRVGSAEVSEE